MNAQGDGKRPERPAGAIGVGTSVESSLETEEMLRAIFRHSRDAICISLNGVQLLVNPAYAALFGYTNPDDFRNTRILDFMAPESREEVGRNIQMRSEGGPAPDFYDLIGLRKDGTTFRVEVNVVSFTLNGNRYTHATMHDVTELRTAQEALKKSEEKFAKAFNSSPEPACISTLDGGVIVDANDAFIAATGLTRKQIVGNRGADLPVWLVPEDDENVQRMLRTKKRVRSLEAHFIGPTGETRDVQLSGDVIEIDGVNYALLFGADVTETKRAQRRMEEYNAELERRVAERTAQMEIANRELESFSYSVSHDLRAPLRTLDGFSRVLMEDFAEQLAPEAKEYLVRICNAANRMGTLVDDLLKLSRLSKTGLEYQTVNLSAICRDVVRKLSEADPERRFDLKVAPGLTVRADAPLMYSVMDNLLGNAWKYSGGRPIAHLEFGTVPHDGKRAFFVRDDGVGFDMAFAGRLFEPFQRLHRESEFPGSGIGLATVQRIIRRHGGAIWAEAAVGKGATFYFTVGPAPRKT